MEWLLGLLGSLLAAAFALFGIAAVVILVGLCVVVLGLFWKAITQGSF